MKKKIFFDPSKSAFYQLARKGGTQNQARLVETCAGIDCKVDDVNCEVWEEGVCLTNVKLPKFPKGLADMKLTRLAQDGNNT